MKRVIVLLFSLVWAFSATAQTQPSIHFREDKDFSQALKAIIREAGLGGTYDAGEDGTETVSFVVIDLSGREPVLGGLYYNNFIYPASVYKMYVAMEVLKQVELGRYSINRQYVVRSPNDVDKSKEIAFDPRPLLKDGDTVTVNYLLDLMITRSDNSAANCLIDIAGRENINNTMHRYGWQGSEVTRKFLSRKYEDPGYDTIRGTETSALHAAEFMYRIHTRELVSPWVSMQMASLLGRQLDTTKLSAGLPRKAMFYHKTGWWSMYTHDVGIVDDGQLRYIICLFTPVAEDKVRERLKIVSGQVYELIKSRNTP